MNFYNMPARRIDELEEQREYPRMNCVLKCTFKTSLLPVKDISSQGVIRNISGGGGLLINVTKGAFSSIDIGDPLELDFKIPSNGDSGIDVGTRARVVRKTTDGLGIKFRNVNQEYKRAIMHLVG